MPDTITLNLEFNLPEVGGSADTWGAKLNANWVKADAEIFSKATKLDPIFAATNSITTLVQPGDVRASAPPAFAGTAGASPGWRFTPFVGSVSYIMGHADGSVMVGPQFRVGFGATPDFAVVPGGDGFFAGDATAVAFFTSSDQALKQDIEEIDGETALTALRAVGAHSYTRNGVPEFGVIAQRLEQAGLDRLVTVGPDTYRRVNYNGLIAELIAALIHIDDRLRALEPPAP
ncbi:tail fiber domain-containing protein [Sphingomonas baiyangensis]|uniref:Tail fiber domain-containing protein n=1 Tax=Sphingomonas baiyangensis TaxID=2572576 RepID=A0A4U1L173_9SPHN|nr:tail fiber domain-containing protein [Sphingomonas baiyangensis]TKD50577.1 tail fiber domain-containing protein [Sphingomonas baiyangensis]